MKYDYKLKCNFGQTLGIGMRLKDTRIWLSYNGKFLNEPSRKEVIKGTTDKKLLKILKDEEEIF